MASPLLSSPSLSFFVSSCWCHLSPPNSSFLSCYKNPKPRCSALVHALIVSPPLSFPFSPPTRLLSASLCISASAHPPAQHHSSPLRLQHQHPHTHTRRIIPPAKFSSVVLWRREARRRTANCPPPQRSCSLDNLTAFNNSISPRHI